MLAKVNISFEKVSKNIEKIAIQVAGKYYLREYQNEQKTKARNMVLKMIHNPPDNRIKKKEFSKEVAQAFKIEKAKPPSQAEINNVISEICEIDQANKEFYKLK